jgi:hypothetical protein
MGGFGRLEGIGTKPAGKDELEGVRDRQRWRIPYIGIARSPLPLPNRLFAFKLTDE